jgi:hypothetical protein
MSRVDTELQRGRVAPQSPKSGLEYGTHALTPSPPDTGWRIRMKAAACHRIACERLRPSTAHAKGA